MRHVRSLALLACSIVLVPATLAPAQANAAGTAPGAIGPAPTSLYLESVFGLFLGRAPSAGEVDTWSEAVHRGERAAVTRALAASDEWAGQRVDDLYRTVLDRPADEAGRAHWVAAIGSGLRLEDVAARFFGSDEYFARVGGSNAPFVDAVYRDLLGRTADAGGRAHWVDRLERGELSRSGAAAAFYASVESRRDRVAAQYAEILDRPPDAAGHRHWMDRLLRIGEVELAATLAASDERFHLGAGVPAPTVRVVPVGPGTSYPLTHSWRPGCPVHHADLAAVEFSHLRDDGTVGAGVLIVHRSLVADTATAVRSLYGSGFPLTSARPVDDFGGDDDRSMEADNSSAFNCRVVAGTSTWSEHAHGRAIDLNPRRNPHVRGSTVEPPSGAAWLDRDDVRPGMIVEPGPVVAAFDDLGWGWGGRWSDASDYQHFSTTGR